MNEHLSRYFQQFRKLKRAHNGGGAPHKPILLLAVLNLVRNGTINSNNIQITSDLVLEFKEVWSQLVSTNHIPTFSLPFFHLRSEPFWKLFPKVLPLPQSISSLGVLRRFVWSADIDTDLFLLMNNEITASLLESMLLQKYFPDAQKSYRNKNRSYATNVEQQILNEDKKEYENRIDELAHTLSTENFEEEIFVRGGVFKKVVPRIYNYQCAISGMRIESTSNAQMVDACHIIAFSESKDDTITNGICLSPNLHRAFDRGLVKITSDYKVCVSPLVIENESPYAIRQFENRQILLPNEQKYFPLKTNFVGHGNKWSLCLNDIKCYIVIGAILMSNGVTNICLKNPPSQLDH